MHVCYEGGYRCVEQFGFTAFLHRVGIPSFQIPLMVQNVRVVILGPAHGANNIFGTWYIEESFGISKVESRFYTNQANKRIKDEFGNIKSSRNYFHFQDAYTLLQTKISSPKFWPPITVYIIRHFSETGMMMDLKFDDSIGNARLVFIRDDTLIDDIPEYYDPSEVLM